MIPVALAGAGRWGHNLLRALQRLPEFELCATCDPRPIAAGVPHYTELSELLSDRRCEAVVIATPPELHARHAEQVLTAGAHALVEKPMCSSSAEAARLVALSSGAGPRLMVGHLLAYDPAFRALVRCVRGCPTDSPLTISAVRWSPSLGRAIRCPWWTLAPHDLSMLRRILPAPRRLRVVRSGPTELAELVAFIEFAGGSSARLAYRTQGDSKLRRFEVAGAGVQWVLDDLAEHRLLECRAGRQRTVMVGCEMPLDEELRHFASALRMGTPFETGADEGSAVVELLECGQRSLDAGGAWVSLPGHAAGAQC